MKLRAVKYILPLILILLIGVIPINAQGSLFDETKTVPDNNIWYFSEFDRSSFL